MKDYKQGQIMNIEKSTLLSDIKRLNALPAGGLSISGDNTPVAVNTDAQLPAPAQGSSGELGMGSLGEIDSPPPVVEDSVSSDGGTAALASESGSGGLTVKMAASIYVLNHSFDEQKGVLELIA